MAEELTDELLKQCMLEVIGKKKAKSKSVEKALSSSETQDPSTAIDPIGSAILSTEYNAQGMLKKLR